MFDSGTTTGASNTGSLTSPEITGISSTSTLSVRHFRQVEDFNGSYDRTRVEVVTAAGATTVFSLDSSDPSTSSWVTAGPIDLSDFEG